MKILIIRFSSIGDIILTTPVIRACKLQLGAEVHLLTKHQHGDLLKSNPHLSKIISFKNHLKEIKGELLEANYDYVADLHHNLRSFQVKRWLGKPGNSFPKLNLLKWIYVNVGMNKLPELHIVDRYFMAVPMVKKDGLGLEYYIKAEDQVNLNLSSYVVLVLGATYFTKRIPKQKITNIISLLKCPIVLVGGPEEKNLGAEFENQYRNVTNACGKYSIAQSASIIEQSSYVITSDTGMMHIAVALKKPIAILWGNTVPEFGMGPYQTSFDSFEVKGLGCRPCSKLGKAECPKKHFRCMMDQDVQAVSELATQWLNHD
ncbi:glycosyltransferase family 9 protein [Portibacter marinus]|uniref:glycosyltransferase family 9 protein n=1 Tax=Portibacter marinus TaxID=2898660 RepID=UPI001F223E9C|nr:glycosyltransferase family 9 protein [Portibacter marinus]